jgi:hypothetical protein
MARLLSDELEPLFFHKSKGFRVASNARGFFDEVSHWPGMDWLVKCSITNILERIEHNLLAHCLINHFGNENSAFVHLVIHFVKINNHDRVGSNFRRQYMGIPQESPITLLLMNFFLNHLDMNFFSFDVLVKGCDDINRLHKIHYARFKDMIVFGVPRKHSRVDNTTG